jgi:hypothetical protein
VNVDREADLVNVDGGADLAAVVGRTSPISQILQEMNLFVIFINFRDCFMLICDT